MHVVGFHVRIIGNGVGGFLLLTATD